MVTRRTGSMADGGDWESDRLAVTHAEARSVLEAQNDTMGDIDSKAMRTVRFNVLLIGLLITAARFAGSETFDGGFVHVAIGSLVASTVLGIVTYNESDLFLGPQGTYLEDLADDDTECDRWDRDLVETFAGMVSQNEDAIDWNSWLLTAAQGALILGIGAGVLAALI